MDRRHRSGDRHGASGRGRRSPTQRQRPRKRGNGLSRFGSVSKKHARGLNLTDEQVDQVRPILRAGFGAMLEVLEEHGIDIGNRSGSGRRLRFRQLRRLQRDLNAVGQQTIENLGAVLNDEQIEIYKEIQEENQEAMRERLRRRR